MTNAERVQLGANLLDERVPGWAARVNLDTFNITNEHECVLAQVYRVSSGRYSAYAHGLETLFGFNTITETDQAEDLAVGHGFDMSVAVTGAEGPTPPSFETERDELNELWREAVQMRQANAHRHND
jgi:hypothetical protein